MKFIIGIFIFTSLAGCNSPSSSSTPKIDTAVASPTPNQGFRGHVYAYYAGPAPICDSDVCPTNVPMRSPMPNIHLAVVGPDMKEIFAETVSLEDGSYQVNVVPGTYLICIKWETGMMCNHAVTVPKNTYIVEDFDVGQG